MGRGRVRCVPVLTEISLMRIYLLVIRMLRIGALFPVEYSWALPGINDALGNIFRGSRQSSYVAVVKSSVTPFGMTSRRAEFLLIKMTHSCSCRLDKLQGRPMRSVHLCVQSSSVGIESRLSYRLGRVTSW